MDENVTDLMLKSHDCNDAEDTDDRSNNDGNSTSTDETTNNNDESSGGGSSTNKDSSRLKSSTKTFSLQKSTIIPVGPKNLRIYVRMIFTNNICHAEKIIQTGQGRH